MTTQTASRTAAMVREQARPQYDCPVIGQFDEARAILRNPDVVQAGRGADKLPRDNPANLPIFFLDGDIHKKRRSQIARFFSPKAMRDRWSPVVDASTKKLITRLRTSGREELDQLSFELACDVTAAIVGLTNSDSRAMALRIRRSFRTLANQPKTKIGKFAYGVRQGWRVLMVYTRDVLPAIKAREAERQDDVISFLLDEGYSKKSIFIECQTYGSAGMMTTREFIVVASWQLFDNPDLRTRYLEGDGATQMAILEEILRLDPVVTYLHRKATTDFTTPSGAEVKAGEYYAIDLRTINTDASLVGECPLELDIERAKRARMTSSWMTFGDGPHRCPGGQVALHETRTFLDALFRVPGIRMTRPPTPSWTGTTYELHGAIIECDRA